jgi:hypothetical protein
MIKCFNGFISQNKSGNYFSRKPVTNSIIHRFGDWSFPPNRRILHGKTTQRIYRKGLMVLHF